MENASKYTFIIQARSGSTRLPDKMNLPFYKQFTILDIIIRKLLERFSNLQIVLATTASMADDTIAKIGRKYEIMVYRGDEQNVLNRFIMAAKKNHAENIIRICADNPFLMNDFIEKLITSFNASPCDYLSFKTHDNTPSIKTHFGFFTEITTLKSLIDVSAQTSDMFYQEHVTNFIYAHPERYKLNFEFIPPEIEAANIRLTVDTLDDFNVCKEIYAYHADNNYAISPNSIIDYIDKNDHLKKLMIQQINLNKK